MRSFLSVLAFQAGWWSAILSAGANLDFIGWLVIVAVLLPWIRISENPRRTVVFVALAFAVGFITESVLIAAGVFGITSGWHPVAWLCPLWLAMMWANFAITLEYCLAWLKKRPVLAAILGGLGGPGTYYAGQPLGVITFHDHVWISMLILAVVWAVITPGLFLLRERISGFFESGAPSARASAA